MLDALGVTWGHEGFTWVYFIIKHETLKKKKINAAHMAEQAEQEMI